MRYIDEKLWSIKVQQVSREKKDKKIDRAFIELIEAIWLKRLVLSIERVVESD